MNYIDNKCWCLSVAPLMLISRTLINVGAFISRTLINVDAFISRTLINVDAFISRTLINVGAYQPPPNASPNALPPPNAFAAIISPCPLNPSTPGVAAPTRGVLSC
jgi:hypothetical protein